jgi:hypothetical protein
MELFRAIGVTERPKGPKRLPTYSRPLSSSPGPHSVISEL